MSCVINHNNKTYSLEDFKNVLLQEPSLLKEVINKSQEKLKAIQEIFNQNPELSKIGDVFSYAIYLDTIFPDSKIKDILWHSSSNADIEKFDFKYFGTNSDKGMFGVATYLEKNRKDSLPYNRTGTGKTYGVLVNIQNPVRFSEITDWISMEDTNEQIQQRKEEIHQKYDSAILGDWQYAIFNNDNTHILGSKQDIEGFKEFVSNKSNQVENIEAQIDSYKLKKQNIFTVTSIRPVDKKATVKASVANKFIGYGEGIVNSSTESYRQQIIEQENNKNPKAKGKMIFAYGNNKRNDISSSTTLEAIKKGERTATTRYEDDGHINYWKNLKVGDIIEWEGQNGEKVLVVVTKSLHKLVGSNKTAEQWSKLEGWSVDYFNSKVKPKLNEAWQIEYKLLESTKIANTGNYNSNDVIFVSIGGKRGNEQVRKEQQDKTIREALKAIEAGATLITDNVNYIHTDNKGKLHNINMSVEEFSKTQGLYNEGEKRLAKNLEYKGYNYSEQTVDGQVLGIWKKEQERANVSDDTIDRHAESYKQMLEDIKNEPITEYKELDSKHDIEEFKKFVEKDKIDKPITEQENTKALLSEAISERKDSICDSQLCRTLIDTLSKNIFVNGEKIERIITPQTPITPMSRVLPILESMLRQANATFTNSLEVLKSSISSMYMGRALSNEEALTNDPTFYELANFFYINDVGPDTEVDETISIKNIARNNIEKIQDKETEEAVYGLNNISDKEELLNRLPSLITGSLEIGDLITNKQALELCPELKNLTIEINPNITESIIIKKTKIGSIPILSLRRLSDSTGTIDENVGQKVENAIALFVQAKCGFLNGVTSLNYKNNFTQLKDLNSLILSKLNLLESITEEQRETEKFKAIQYEINMLNDTMYQLLMGLYKINDENPFNSKETVEILPISRKLSEAAMKSSAYSGARLNHDGSVNLNSEQARTVMQSLGIYPVTEKNKLCRIP